MADGDTVAAGNGTACHEPGRTADLGLRKRMIIYIMYFLLVDSAVKSKIPPGNNNGASDGSEGGRDQSTVT